MLIFEQLYCIIILTLFWHDISFLYTQGMWKRCCW